mmetsp:Transcript_2141/g.5725  ORF Transcript_2141/g.5725 Transcript_2141/m.5725 type:complete len:529 (+) Transcript_2141:9-1595(+)
MRAHHGSSGSGSSMSMLDPNWKLNIASGTTPLSMRRSGRSSSSSSSLFSMVMNSLGRSRGVMCLVIVVVVMVFRYWLYGSSHSFGVSAARGAFVSERKFVVLDAGSSGTRIHVFTFKKATPPTSAAFHRKSTRGAGNGHTDDGAEALVANVELQLPAPSKKQKPGLSSFVGRPADAAATLRPLLQFAEVHVAPAERATTPVALFATAGLRAVQSDEAENILQACAEVLGRSGFAVPATVGTWSTSGGASIIPGELEGRWSWLAARYAASRAGAPAPTSKGVGSRAQLAATSASRVTDAGGFLGLVEMGGASTQVVYPIADSAAVKAPRVDPLDKSHGAFVRSYLGLGLEMAQAAAAKVQAAAAAKRDAELEERRKAAAEAARKAEEAKSSSSSMPGMGGFPGGMPGMGGFPGGGMPPGMEGLMNDPELMAAMSNPKVMAAMTSAMSNPASLMQYMSDPEVGPVLTKLMGKMGGGMGGMPGGMGGMPGGGFGGAPPTGGGPTPASGPAADAGASAAPDNSTFCSVEEID